MLGKKILTHSWLVIKTMQRGLRSDLYQIAVTFFVFCEHQQVVVGVAVRRRSLDAMIGFFADV